MHTLYTFFQKFIVMLFIITGTELGNIVISLLVYHITIKTKPLTIRKVCLENACYYIHCVKLGEEGLRRI